MSLKPMFISVAQRYDLVNSVLTWGLDKRWRMRAASECKGRVILDLACGTGDMALYLRQRAGPDAYILSLDFSKEMLSIAKFKVAQHHLSGNSDMRDFILADASQLPIRGSSLDCIVISFAFRNLTFRNPNATRFLSEITRALTLSSHFVFVETSQPRNAIIRIAYHLYLQRIVPRLGGLLSGKRGPYTYLGCSAAHYPDAETVAQWLRQAGFQRVGYKLLTLGIVSMFSTQK